MTANSAKPESSITQTQSNRKGLRSGWLALGLLVFGGMLFFHARWLLVAPPVLQPEDLLLLERESFVRVEAAAKAGDILAQSTLGAAYLDEHRYLPRDVTKAVYWWRKVADRDQSELDRIESRMQFVLKQRSYEINSPQHRAMDLEYLDLIAKKLAFESAFLGLIQVYLGGQGADHAKPELALKYLRLGADYGFPSVQRTLGIMSQFGLLGVPKDEVQATRLLSEAAAQGDPIAQRLLSQLRLDQARTDTVFSGPSLS